MDRPVVTHLVAEQAVVGQLLVSVVEQPVEPVVEQSVEEVPVDQSLGPATRSASRCARARRIFRGLTPSPSSENSCRTRCLPVVTADPAASS